MFFLSTPPDPLFQTKTEAGRDAVRIYAAFLVHYSPLARATPLFPGYAFAFHSSLPGGQDLSVSGRPLSPPLLRPGTWTLTLDRPLKDHSEHPSKMSSGVWVARVGTSMDSNSSLPDFRPLVVVKFIQPSLLPYPGDDYEGEERPKFHHGWTHTYNSPDWYARLEAASYDHLDSLQGSVIPYFFGKDIVKTPCGEEAWALVTEYIDGSPLSDLLGSRERQEYFEFRETNDPSVHFHTISMQELGPIWASAYEGLEKIHSLNVVHGDVAARNIVVPSDRSKAPVWIDFRSLARDIEEDLTWGYEKDKERDALVDDIMWESLSCRPCQIELDSWCAANIPWYTRVVSEPTDEEPTDEALQAAIREAEEFARIEDAEWNLRAIWRAEHGNLGSLEKNIPLLRLVATDVDVP